MLYGVKASIVLDILMGLDFKKAYKRLNPSQKEAVDTIDGPLMVIAGPGTGKTQLLSLRVANILDKTDVNAENILCLTFSESGAEQMQKRLIDIIGLDAYRVNISTYHTFGSELIRANPEYFNNYASLKPLNDLATDAIIRSIQDELSYSNPFKDISYAKQLKSLISDFKKALITPHKLDQVILSNQNFIDQTSELTRSISNILTKVKKSSKDDFKKLILKDQGSNIDGLDNLAFYWNQDLLKAIDEANISGKNKQLSEWKGKYLAKDENGLFIAAGAEQNRRLGHFSEIYKKYINRLESEGFYDFDDMILMSIDGLINNLDFKYTVQEKYQYILLDEYQDTNEAQSRLVELLTDNPIFEGKPNVMAVGDDDQAIFVFQGARYSHMIDFINRYKDVKLVTLKENYRSAANIIDFSAKIASQIETRLSNEVEQINKNFISANSDIQASSKITRINFKNQSQEFSFIAKQIAETYDPNHQDGQIAVLSPKHKYLEALVPYLQKYDVPISYERRENVLNDPIINQIINFANTISAIKNKQSDRNIDAYLAKLLCYDFWELPTDIVWQTSWKASETRKPWLKVLLSQDKTRLICLFILKLAANSENLKFDYLLDQIIGLSEITIQDKQQLIYRSPIYDYYRKTTQADKTIAQMFSYLVAIREQFKNYHNETTRPLMLDDFVDFINQTEASELKILSPNTYVESTNSVELMTAYKAKGQEFKDVYIISTVDKIWGSSARSSNSRFSLPPNLSYISYQTKDEDERLRLLYVASTRARQGLYISSFSESSDKTVVKPLIYLNEQSNDDGDTISPLLPNNSQLVRQINNAESNENLILKWQQDYKPIEIKADLKQLLKTRLEKYQLSPTELNSFIDVRNAGPINFYNRILLKYPSPVSPVVDYGSAVHDSLDWLQKEYVKTGQMPDFKHFYTKFETNLSGRRLSENDLAKLLERGEINLNAYYSKYKNSFSELDLSEVNFRHEAVFLDKAHLNGKVDKLIIDKPNKTISIVDYKTGKSYIKRTQEAKIHLYINQLYFYKILVENSTTFNNFEVKDAYLDFVEPDNNGQLNRLQITYDKQTEERIANLITAVWQRIQDLDFPDVSNYSADLKGIKNFEDDLINKKIA